MRKLRKRALLLIGLGVMLVPLAITAVAYACTAVSTLSISPGAATAGSTVTVTGKFFGTHNPADATSDGPAQIRLGSLSGPVLATASPSGTDRSFTVQVTIPKSAAAGDTFLAATQQTASGTAVYGTPSRQAFTVSAPATAPPTTFGPVTEPSATPASVPTKCVVPGLKGKSSSAAKDRLTAAHCALGTVTKPKKKPHHKAHHTYRLVVASSAPGAGATRASGTKVNLRLHWV